MDTKRQHITQLIKNCIKSVDPNAEIILFGSRARGDYHNESDWDILILSENKYDLEIERNIRDLLYDLELELNQVFSIFVYSQEEWYHIQKITPFYKNVSKEGINL